MSRMQIIKIDTI